jgi:hypothetical protein
LPPSADLGSSFSPASWPTRGPASTLTALLTVLVFAALRLTLAGRPRVGPVLACCRVGPPRT